ncbi:hypothetical protein J6590_024480 [Homalodisca vitripennis]|nr:hypothetical protein J6590_024480 [Homalodisca vitripennis]
MNGAVWRFGSPDTCVMSKVSNPPPHCTPLAVLTATATRLHYARSGPCYVCTLQLHRTSSSAIRSIFFYDTAARSNRRTWELLLSIVQDKAGQDADRA